MGVPKNQTDLEQPSADTCGRYETLAKNLNVLFSKGNHQKCLSLKKTNEKRLFNIVKSFLKATAKIKSLNS